MGAQSLLDALRAEHAEQVDPAVQAVLLHELAVLEEQAGNESGAAKDELASHETDPDFREPVEGLLRMLRRRKSVKNLGTVLRTLVEVASTAEEQGRAHLALAQFQKDIEGDLPGAESSIQQAIGATPEDPTCWLLLELLATKTGDRVARASSIEARAELCGHPMWKAILLLDLADLALRDDQPSRAFELLDAASALDAPLTFQTRVLLERAALAEGNVESLARALEGQGDLIAEAMEDSKRGDDAGVPDFVRTAPCAADAWLRSAELLRRTGDVRSAGVLLERAARALPNSPVVARARLLAAEVAGDANTVWELARQEIERNPGGADAAALWCRVAELALREGRAAEALGCVESALRIDPGSVVAQGLLLALAAKGEDAERLASAVTGLARGLSNRKAQAGMFLVAAVAWGALAVNSGVAREMLDTAARAGASADSVARLARSLASVTGDGPWFEAATLHAAEIETDPARQMGLWLELLRLRLTRQDAAGAADAAQHIMRSGASGALWLGRVLAAYLPSNHEDRASRAASLLALSEAVSDERLQLGCHVLVEVLRAPSSTNVREHLVALWERDRDSLTLGVLLSTMFRAAGELRRAAEVLVEAVGARGDYASYQLKLEGALLFWRAGERERAVDVFRSVSESLPSASALVTMAERQLRGVEAESPEAHHPVGQLMRFGGDLAQAGSVDGATDRAAGWLEELELANVPELRQAIALGRLLLPGTHKERVPFERALDALEGTSGPLAGLVLGETFEVGRHAHEDDALLLERARTWGEHEESLVPVLEELRLGRALEQKDATVDALEKASRFFGPKEAAALAAHAKMVAHVADPTVSQTLVSAAEASVELANLEISPAGSDPRKRASALHGLSQDTLGSEAQVDAVALAGWSELALKDYMAAKASFGAVLGLHQRDIAAWEGYRLACEATGDFRDAATACAHLGSLCRDTIRGAEFWERAGLLLADRVGAPAEAEPAFERAFSLDPRRFAAFDRYFRSLRSRNEDERLIPLIEQRLTVAETEDEIAKLYWEKARVLRRRSDKAGALEALRHVTMLEPEHVGAIALVAEIRISEGAFAEAAPLLAQLSQMESAPRQQRLLSGIASVDLYETRLNLPARALEVLQGLEMAGLANLGVRERMAKVAARAENWVYATSVLEQLMVERETSDGRLEAARLAFAIWRDQLRRPEAWRTAPHP